MLRRGSLQGNLDDWRPRSRDGEARVSARIVVASSPIRSREPTCGSGKSAIVWASSANRPDDAESLRAAGVAAPGEDAGPVTHRAGRCPREIQAPSRGSRERQSGHHRQPRAGGGSRRGSSGRPRARSCRRARSSRGSRSCIRQRPRRPRSPRAKARIRSRSVMIPASRPASITRTAPTLRSAILWAAATTGSSAWTVSRSRDM